MPSRGLLQPKIEVLLELPCPPFRQLRVDGLLGRRWEELHRRHVRWLNPYPVPRIYVQSAQTDSSIKCSSSNLLRQQRSLTDHYTKDKIRHGLLSGQPNASSVYTRTAQWLVSKAHLSAGYGGRLETEVTEWFRTAHRPSIQSEGWGRGGDAVVYRITRNRDERLQ